jgi:hypothetical protein
MLQQWTSLPYAGQVQRIIILLKRFDRNPQNPPYNPGKIVLILGRYLLGGTIIEVTRTAIKYLLNFAGTLAGINQFVENIHLREG